jgi:hypothetical protein
VRHPDAGGLVRFTRAGLSADGTQALLQFDYSWDALGGELSVLLLELQDGRWRLVHKEVLVIS